MPLRMCLVSILIGLLAGCEAPLDLSGVEDQQARVTQRADLFQAVKRYNDTVIAVGSMGTILQSQDRGGHWQRITLPGKPFLVDVTVCPDGHFYAIDKSDGVFSLQADGHWTRQALPEMTEPQAFGCDFANVLWVTGGFSVILHSDDAGKSWESWSLDEDLYLTTIQFVDAQHGVVTGEFGVVLVTADGGANWHRVNDLPGSFYPQSAYFTDANSGWVVGLNGTIWETADGGQSWAQVPSGSSAPLYGVTGSGDTLLAVGDNTTVLFHGGTGKDWAPINDAAKSRTYLRGVAGLGDGRFITVGGGALFTITVPGNGVQASLGTLGE